MADHDPAIDPPTRVIFAVGCLWQAAPILNNQKQSKTLGAVPRPNALHFPNFLNAVLHAAANQAPGKLKGGQYTTSLRLAVTTSTSQSRMCLGRLSFPSGYLFP